MARRQRHQQQTVGPAGWSRDRLRFSGRMADWLIAWLLLLSSCRNGPASPVQLLASALPAALTPDWAWRVPLAGTGWLTAAFEWPYWLYATVMAVLTVCLVRHRFGDIPAVSRYAVLVTLALLADPADVLPAGMILLALSLCGDRCRTAGRYIWIAGCVGVALAVVTLCLDFSLLLVVLCACWVIRPPEHLPRTLPQLVATAIVTACGLGVLLSEGFAAAALRPVSWVKVPAGLFTVTPLVVEDWWSGLTAAMLVVCVIDVWRHCWKAPEVPLSAIGVCGLLSVLAVTCRSYSWVSVAGMCCVLDRRSSARDVPQRAGLVPAAAVVIAFMGVLPLGSDGWRFVLTGVWPVNLLDPTDWESSGPVLLMDPSASERWAGGELHRRYPVLVDDRWDAFAELYPDYQWLCRDLSEIRNSRYLRTDGQWGGYRPWVERWQPVLLEVPAGDRDSLRRLSLSPHWKTMGIDSQRVILGRVDVDGNRPRIQAAGRLLAELEWPGPGFSGELDGIIVASGERRMAAVAHVLLALRLPYAAMRLMPDDAADADALLALSWFELAHRVYRQTQMHSLLDQYRAVSGLRRLLQRGRLSGTQLLRVARGLEELEQFEVAVDFARASQNESSVRNAAVERSPAADLMERCRARRNDLLKREAAADPEERVRRTLLAGDRPAESDMAELPDGQRDFYVLLTSAADADSETLYRGLIAQLNRPGFPAHLRAEATFYLAGLATEIGDSPGAIQAFQAALRMAPTLPLNSVSRVALSSLSQRSR